MAILNIVEHNQRVVEQGQAIPVRDFGINSQNVAVGVSSTQSAALGAFCKEVTLCADVACKIATGASPTATATSRRLPANAIITIAVTGGDKIATIQE